jgi:hypothetical protein
MQSTALKQAAERCEVVIFLISPAWAASKWCLAEFLLANQLNKPIFGVIIDPTPFVNGAPITLVSAPRSMSSATTVVAPRGQRRCPRRRLQAASARDRARDWGHGQAAT